MTATILDFVDDENIWARWFRDAESWAAWRAFLAATFALPLTADQLATYRECTGRTEPPAEPPQEAWLVCGRRSGKSLITAVIAAYMAVHYDWTRHLAPGEVGTIPVVAVDRRQARTVMRYLTALLTEPPILNQRVQRVTEESIRLAGRVTIEVGTNDPRRLRGYTILSAIGDETAHWRAEDSATPDVEVIDGALRPGMATIPGARLLCISSPHARRGMLWETYREHYGADGSETLVWQAPSLKMNPSLDPRVVERARARDPARAAAEFDAQFRTDVEDFVSQETADAATAWGRVELPPQPGVQYYGFVDPSGGSSDSMTVAVCHLEGERVVVDVVREVAPPFAPDDVTRDFATLARAYGLHELTGDRYGGEWPRERFRAHGIEYRCCPTPKSDLYLALLPELNSGAVTLPDDQRLRSQLVQLERRTARGGKETVDHPPRGHDDVINAAAGAVWLATTARRQDEANEIAAPPMDDARPSPWREDKAGVPMANRMEDLAGGWLLGEWGQDEPRE